MAVGALLIGFWSNAVAKSWLQNDDSEALGPPPLYDALREAKVSHVGQIRDQHLRLDRFDLELTQGHLYLGPEIGGVISTAVFLGDGVIHAYPPDAVEHHQLKKLSDKDHLEETFDRLVLKDSLRHLRRGQVRMLRGQFGYKLPALLKARS